MQETRLKENKSTEQDQPKPQQRFSIDETGCAYWIFTDYDGEVMRMTLPYDLEVYR